MALSIDDRVQSMVHTTETSCCPNISCQLSEIFLEIITSSSKTAHQLTGHERQLHCCSAQRQASSVHCTGLLTVQISTQLTARSGVFCKSVCTEADCRTLIISYSVLWKSGISLIKASWTKQ